VRVSWKWLQEFVEIPITPEELRERLTMAGLEVEALEVIAADFQGVVVGRIARIQEHPHDPRLLLCVVDVGEDRLSIISGARNFKEGDTVPVALPGATLPGGRRIETSVIKGVQSQGMLCSEAELALGPDASGVLILPEVLALGRNLPEALDLEDVILEVAVTPNRGDCLSHLGIAREIAALLRKPLRLPRIGLKELGPSIETLTSVEVRNPELCPRYAARVILNVQISPSPFWLRRRLQTLGFRAINNVVDATNYCMLELGQPLHAFDFEKLGGRRIVVRTAEEGERIVTLDGVERTLAQGMLTIADATVPVAVAGVMGGLESEVTDFTRHLLLESAFFDPVSIRRTSKALGLSTEASYRFERWVDPEGCVRALDRVAALIADLAGGEVARGVVDRDLRARPPRTISLRLKRVEGILGTPVEPREVKGILRALGLKVRGRGGTLEVLVPTFRRDLEREIDLIEEVSRIWGFDRIPVSIPAIRPKPGAASSSLLKVERKAKRLMAAAGFYEAVNFSFTGEEVFDTLKLAPGDPLYQAVRIRNPLSGEGAVLRTSLLPGLLRNVALNESRRMRAARMIRLFEVGRTFHPEGERTLPKESLHLAAVAVGFREEPSWKGSREEVDFYDLKGVLEAIAREFGIMLTFQKEGSVPYFHPTRQAFVSFEGVSLGVIGQVRREVAQGFNLESLPFAFEIDLGLLASLGKEGRTFTPLPKFPAVVRDVALLVPEEAEALAIQRFIEEAGGELVEEVRIFDVYRGEGIPEGKKSLAFSIAFRAVDRTLTDEEVNTLHSQVLNRLQEELGATIR